MIRYVLIFLVSVWLNAPGALESAASVDPAKLPDDYLLFTMDIQDGGLEGQNEYLEGFVVSMQLPGGFTGTGFDYAALINLVRDQEIAGTLTYPNGATTDIRYEVVTHKDAEDIYMKTTLGYFLWDYAVVRDDKLYFVVYWWYKPPARPIDLEIIEMTRHMLIDPANWQKDDDRQCGEDVESNKWSLSCALKYATKHKTGEYNHHGTVMQTAREVIKELKPERNYDHVLMDFNNTPSTNHKDIIFVLDLTEVKVRQELDEKNSDR